MARRRRGSVIPGKQRVGLGPTAFKGFTPYKPPPAPAGSYDPALDAQQRAAGRGLGYLELDTATANERAGVDYGLAREDVTRQRDRGFFDIDQQIAGLQRSYSQLGQRQAEGARVAGVTSGGLALQAAQKRAENMAIDRAPIDLARTRLSEDADLGLGQLDLQFQRGGIDRGTALARGRDENTFFGLDIGEQKSFQAAQSGYEPPGMPKGMGTNKKGVQYVERREGPFIVRYDQHGNVLSKRRRRGFSPVGQARPIGMGIGV